MRKENLVLLFGGIVFGFGLAYGYMSKPEIVLSFLKRTDFGLAVLMATASPSSSNLRQKLRL